jgi:hypothetical protein
MSSQKKHWAGYIVDALGSPLQAVIKSFEKITLFNQY